MQHASDLIIRPAEPADRTGIWSVIEPTIRAGATYALDPLMTKDDALSYWHGADKRTFVAVRQEQIVGSYYVRANQGGGGSHVANCGYMTLARAQGGGVARNMCLHSLDYARNAGFRAMQFNCVVSNNTRAVKLWTTLGFAIVGRLPEAFRLPTQEYVDALVMFRKLDAQ